MNKGEKKKPASQKTARIDRRTTLSAEGFREPFNIDDVPWKRLPGSTAFKRLGAYGGGSQVGVGIDILKPGQYSNRFHYHLREGERVFILKGGATLILGSRRYPMKERDYCCFPDFGKARIRATGKMVPLASVDDDRRYHDHQRAGPRSGHDVGAKGVARHHYADRSAAISVMKRTLISSGSAFEARMQIEIEVTALTVKGCSYFPFSGSTLKTLARELARYDQTKGSLHFLANKPLPTTLVRKLIKTRIGETKGWAERSDLPPTELDGSEADLDPVTAPGLRPIPRWPMTRGESS